MSVSICTECLGRLRLTKKPSILGAVATPAIPHTLSFHSSAAQFKSPLLKKKVLVPQKTGPRKSAGLRIRKKPRDKPYLLPVGERKAARSRLVLSNTNALEIFGMETLTAENMVREDSKGRVLALDGELLDQLRDSKAFKVTQNWNLFRRPSTLVRSETVAIAKDIKEISQTNGKNVRYLVTGDRHSGKSILSLQAMSMAFMKNWVVLNIPEASAFTNNTSAYAPVRAPTSTSADGASPPVEQLYSQSQLAQALLTRAASSNEHVLAALKLNHSPSDPKIKLKPNASLRDLALIGSRDHTLAVTVWQSFWNELNTAGQNPRPPVLISVDGVDHWFGLTKYRSAEYEPIHAQQFTIIKQLTDFLFSAESKPPLVNGGLILFATSGSNDPAFPSFEILMKQIRATRQGVKADSPDFPLPDPYRNPDVRVMGLASRADDIKVMDVKGTSKDESKAILEYFVRSGLFLKALSDEVVSDMRIHSSGGVIGQLAKLGARLKV